VANTVTYFTSHAVNILYIHKHIFFMWGLWSWKSCTNWKHNSHLKQCISWELRDWQPHPIQCVTTPLADIQTYNSINIHTGHSTYAFLNSMQTFRYNILISNVIKT
jgi:hypothetical protein